MVELLPVDSHMTYHGDSGHMCRVLPFQVLLWLQSTCAQLASSESFCFSSTDCFCHWRVTPLLPPLYTPVAAAGMGHGVPGLFWLLGVQFCVSLLWVSAPLSSARGPNSMSLIGGSSRVLSQLIAGKLFCPLWEVENELLRKGLRGCRCPSTLI